MKAPEDIFAAARQLPEDERQAYLEEVCDGPEQRALVNSLLTDAAVADCYFEETETVVRPAAEKPGDHIGPYKLLQEIGEGGFGVVFMAEQRNPITRRVALKVIKQGMDTREVIARFEAERQALAMMDHPNIAQIFDAGATERGRPYFVMELVKGLPLTKFCDEQKLDTHRRLELFLDVCSAVNHAHQKGVIHRDLKPTNILVTLHGDKAVPKVIDFGIAKATQQQLTEKTLFTLFEQFVGTPVYMSPEQAVLSGLDIDTRADIYSLGVLLYELLAGRPPFDSETLRSAGYDEMRRIIREEEPPKPSTCLASLQGKELTGITGSHGGDPHQLGNQLRGDLDWIVMKAIEKDRARRYETANGFALDIKRFLADEPVTAAAPSAVYRFRKFARRHRGRLAAAGVVMISLLLGTVLSTWQWVRADREAQTVKKVLAELRANAPALLAEARILVNLRQYDSAIARIDHALELHPDRADYRLARERVDQSRVFLRQLSELQLQYEFTAREDLSLALAIYDRHVDVSVLDFLADAPISELTLQPLDTGDIDFLRGFQLDKLDLSRTRVANLAPLTGMPLQVLRLQSTKASDLSALEGMPLRELDIGATKVTDLTPLTGMPLRKLNLQGTGVTDLSPLEGLPLQELLLDHTAVTDLEPLRGMESMERIALPHTIEDFSPLRTLPLLRWMSFRQSQRQSAMPAEEFWRMDPEEFTRAWKSLKRQDWEGAQQGFANFGQAVLSTNRNGRDLLRVAAVLAHGQDQSAYVKFCGEVLGKLAPPDASAHDLKHTALILMMRPHGIDSPLTVGAHDSICRAEAFHPDRGFDGMTLGLAKFRRGFHREAAHILKVCWSGKGQKGLVLSARAMAEFQLGNREGALALLEEAREKVSSDMAMLEEGLETGTWQFPLMGHLFLQEAELLIKP